MGKTKLIILIKNFKLKNKNFSLVLFLSNIDQTHLQGPLLGRSSGDNRECMKQGGVSTATASLRLYPVRWKCTR